MILDRAIELLRYIKETGEYEGEPDDSQAVGLGIEALRAIKGFRHFANPYVKAPLPGETEKGES